MIATAPSAVCVVEMKVDVQIIANISQSGTDAKLANRGGKRISMITNKIKEFSVNVKISRLE